MGRNRVLKVARPPAACVGGAHSGARAVLCGASTRRAAALAAWGCSGVRFVAGRVASSRQVAERVTERVTERDEEPATHDTLGHNGHNLGACLEVRVQKGLYRGRLRQAHLSAQLHHPMQQIFSQKRTDELGEPGIDGRRLVPRRLVAHSAVGSAR